MLDNEGNFDDITATSDAESNYYKQELSSSLIYMFANTAQEDDAIHPPNVARNADLH